MKRFTAGVIAGFLLSWGVTFAASTASHNGLFWKKLDRSAKSGYVDGYGDAMQVSVGKLDNLTVAADLFHWRGAKKIIGQLSRELLVSNSGRNDLVKRLDDLYSNRSYTDLDLGSALQLLTMRAGEASQPPTPPVAK